MMTPERRGVIAYRIFTYVVAKEQFQLDSLRGLTAEISKREGIAIDALEMFTRRFMVHVVLGGQHGKYDVEPTMQKDGIMAYRLLLARTRDQRFRAKSLKGKLANLVEPTGVPMSELKKFAAYFLIELNLRALADDSLEATRLLDELPQVL